MSVVWKTILNYEKLIVLTVMVKVAHTLKVKHSAIFVMDVVGMSLKRGMRHCALNAMGTVSCLKKRNKNALNV
jgi:hypothetical protein